MDTSPRLRVVSRRLVFPDSPVIRKNLRGAAIDRRDTLTATIIARLSRRDFYRDRGRGFEFLRRTESRDRRAPFRGARPAW